MDDKEVDHAFCALDVGGDVVGLEVGLEKGVAFPAFYKDEEVFVVVVLMEVVLEAACFFACGFDELEQGGVDVLLMLWLCFNVGNNGEGCCGGVCFHVFHGSSF